MSFSFSNSPKKSVWSATLVLVPLLLICTSVAADDLVSDINTVLKAELEEEFGPLNDQKKYDETKIYGRVISIDYELPEGTRLDDTWGDKVVAALARLGISGKYDGGEVRAMGRQSPAGRPPAAVHNVAVVRRSGRHRFYSDVHVGQQSEREAAR